MWIRKSSEEITKERRASRLSLKRPALWFVGLFVIGIVEAFRGPYRNTQRWQTPTWSETLIVSTIFASMGAVVRYMLQLLTLRNEDPLRLNGSKVMICNSCYQTKHVDGKDTCECSGKFEDFDTWKWVDEDGWNLP